MTVAHVNCFQSEDGLFRMPAPDDVVAVIDMRELFAGELITLPGAVGYISGDGLIETDPGETNESYLIHQQEPLLVITSSNKAYCTGESGLYRFLSSRRAMMLLDVTADALNQERVTPRRRARPRPRDPEPQWVVGIVDRWETPTADPILDALLSEEESNARNRPS